MTSRAKIEANRRNALRSTGPRTPEGKARSRRNALKHGLSIPVSRDSAIAGEIEAIAAVFAPLIEGSRETAQLAAELQLQVARLRRRRSQLIEQSIENIRKIDSPISQQTAEALGMAAALPETATFERYEQRALSGLRNVLRGKKRRG